MFIMVQYYSIFYASVEKNIVFITHNIGRYEFHLQTKGV